MQYTKLDHWLDSVGPLVSVPIMVAGVFIPIGAVLWFSYLLSGWMGFIP